MKQAPKILSIVFSAVAVRFMILAYAGCDAASHLAGSV
jgi:hypothetical protein